MRRLPFPFVAIAIATVIAACAAPGSRAGGARPQRNLIRAEEIAGTGAATAFEAVERLRPEYLRGRGKSTVRAIPDVNSTAPDAVLPQVYVDGVNAGSVQALRAIPATHVREVRFISAADATTRFGTNHANGVIEVITR
ncbi:MAG TPA: hypothetical protein VNA89_02180 [Gemmatimonadaceae bacterium]|nr:hypothetical protein [Gemmatimonadaceae bacterium]